MTVETARVCIAVFPAYHPQISTCGFWLRLGDDCQLAINPEQLPGPRGSLAGGRIGCSAVSKRGPRTRGRSNRGSLSAATSSELLEPVPSDDSTAIPVRKSRQLSSNHKVEKILSQLKESDLKHVPNLLRSFKSKKSESLASGEDDKSNFSRSKSLAKPTSALEVMSSDSDSPNLRRRSKRQKKHYQRSSLSSTSDQTQLNPKNVRRSTRSSQSRPKYNFRTHISSEEEEEEDELEESGSDCSKQKKNRKNQRNVMSEESDESEYKSGRSRSQNQSKAVARKGFLPEGRKPRSEHHPDCTKCGIEFQTGLVSAWIKADKNQKSKVRTGSLLDCFLSLEEFYAQGCWLECSNFSSSYHFGCLPADMKKDIAAQHKAERLSIMEQLEKNCENNPGKIINPSEIPPERKERQPDLKHVTKCPMCFKSNGALCMKCGNNSDLKHQTTNALLSSPGSPPQESMGKLPSNSPIYANKKVTVSTEKEDEAKLQSVAHYSCLPLSGEDYPTDLGKIAEYWQRDWSCADCDELSNIELENILAWRRPTIKKTSHTTLPSAPEQSILGSLHDSPRGRDNNKTRSDVKLSSWKHPFEEAEYLFNSSQDAIEISSEDHPPSRFKGWNRTKEYTDRAERSNMSIKDCETLSTSTSSSYSNSRTNSISTTDYDDEENNVSIELLRNNDHQALNSENNEQLNQDRSKNSLDKLGSYLTETRASSEKGGLSMDALQDRAKPTVCDTPSTEVTPVNTAFSPSTTRKSSIFENQTFSEQSKDTSKDITSKYGADHAPGKKWKTIATRVIWSLVMVCGFIGL
ncbi:hypothetical protein PPACK8108_LOCUS8426 [Phakopsora pachyrhizi]|uniref:Zinc finger PHD-type domain-containing protein n=1 Tax=Phakopsora pachyrhizi TaxID=170000 RepID=A0AAV0AWF4_PHAPC|nr:hypothetical protein PPACK8108_LOCUS8426 [Phakopsora pachyrhizi]